MGDGPADRGPGTALIALGMAVLFGVAVAGGSVFTGAGTEATTRDALPYALLGAGVVLALVALAFAVARQTVAGFRRPSITMILVTAFVAAVTGALLGIALTPRSPTADDVSSLTDDEIERRLGSLESLEGAIVRPMDLDGDGEADRDADGNPILGYDEDGDGHIDGYLQPCPDVPLAEPQFRAFGHGSAARSVAVSLRRAGPGEVVPYDADCDGEIDAYLEFDPGPAFGGEGAAPPPAEPPATIPPDERAERAADQGDGRFGRSVLIALAVLAGLTLLAGSWVYWQRRRDGDGDADGEGESPTPGGLAQPIRATIDVMERDDDPRRAICEAYGVLLDQLAAAGLPRRPEEAPGEHIARCLGGTPLDEASVTELIDLFVLARFSTHPVTEVHRAAAVRCLRDAMPADRREPVGAASWPAPGAGS